MKNYKLIGGSNPNVKTDNPLRKIFLLAIKYKKTLVTITIICIILLIGYYVSEDKIVLTTINNLSTIPSSIESDA